MQQSTVSGLLLFIFLSSFVLCVNGGRISISRGKNVTKIEDLCARMHNNTALEGTSPLLMMQASAYECQKKCVDLFPECSAVVYYYLHNETSRHFCYLFEENSIHEKIELVEQKPEHKKDIVRMLELVTDCHQFDAHPPLEEDGLASSTDKVDRKKRQQSDEAVMGVGDWTDWSVCTTNGHETRSQACQYGRKIQRRGCPARSAPQRIPAPPAPQFPPRQPQYPQQQQQQQQQQQREQQLREQQAREQQIRIQQQQQQQRQPQPQSPQQQQPQQSAADRQRLEQQQRQEQQRQEQLRQQQQQQQQSGASGAPGSQLTPEQQRAEQIRQHELQQRQQQIQQHYQSQSGQSQIQLQTGPAAPPATPPQLPPLERSPLDQHAQLYQQRMAQYRENYNQRHPAKPVADPCPGGYCAPPINPGQSPTAPPQLPPAPEQRPTPPPVLAPVINTATLPPLPNPYPTRYRPAPPPPPACDGQGCAAPIVVPGNWHDWSDWSQCSCTCGDGAKSRRRECATNNCQGPDFETETCNLGPCETWSEWCEWSTCSGSCGTGERSRTRFCHLGTNRCEGKDFEAESCNAGPCPEWTNWEDWGSCSVTCGTGVATRERVCLTQNGLFCEGEKIEQRACEAGPCSIWSPWQDWSSCSASCGNGMKRRLRVCQYGTDCAGPNEESQFCYGPPCAEWTEWCEWSGCSSKCGPGQQTRTRGCLASDGKEATTCQGLSIETKLCEGQSCCNWSDWCHWSMCDKECGGGQSIRTRTCVNGAGVADATCHCDGVDREEKQCNTQSCAPQCAWNQWCEWSPCSTPLECEVGVQNRTRQCVGESGCHCIGLAEESQQCRGINPCAPKPPC